MVGIKIDLARSPRRVMFVACEPIEPSRLLDHVEMTATESNDPPRHEFWRNLDMRIRWTFEKRHLLAGHVLSPDHTRTVFRTDSVIRPTRKPIHAVVMPLHPGIDRHAFAL